MITAILISLAILTILTCLAIRERKKSVGKLFWHIHHDQLLEMATEPIARRKTHIRRYKAPEEIETRLRCLRPVKGTLPDEVIEAFRFHADFLDSLDKKLLHRFCGLCDMADADLRVTSQKYESEINRLHDEECSCCPWDGITLFPGG